MEVRAPMELSLRVVSRVGQGTGVLGTWGGRAPSGRGSFGGLKSCFGLEISGRQTTAKNH